MEKTMSSSSNKRHGVMAIDSSANNSPQKRAKSVKQQDRFDLLTDDATLLLIFEFIGSYHFRFIAGVSRRFRSIYTQFQREELRKRVKNAVDCEDFIEEDFGELIISTAITSPASIAESLSRAKIFLSDTTKLTANTFKPIVIQENGSQQMKSFLYRQPPLHYLRDKVAVPYGHLEILQLVVAKGAVYASCWTAAFYGHLGVLQCLRANGCPWDESTCKSAAEGGHLEVLQWAREKGCPWNEDTCSFAAGNGHLGVLQWARENGCPWDEWTCCFAAKGGHLDLLQWARDKGCPWNVWTCRSAAEGGYLGVLQ